MMNSKQGGAGVYAIVIVLIILVGAWFLFTGDDAVEVNLDDIVEGGTDSPIVDDAREGDEVPEEDPIEDPGDLEGGEIQTVTVDIIGRNFNFDVTEIRVNVGDTVIINFESDEGFHDWVVDEFNAATGRVLSGQTTEVTFVADTAGTYQYYCSVGQHRALGMVGMLIVE